MTANAKLNPKEVRDNVYEAKAQLKSVEEKIYQTMEVSALLTQLTQFKERIEELKGKLAKAENERVTERDTFLKASRSLEEELESRKNECLQALKEQFKLKKEYEDKIAALMSEKNDEILLLRNEMASAKQELKQKISEQHEELRNLKDFKDRQDEYFSQVESLKKRCDELIITHNDDLKRIDDKTSKAIQKQQQKHEKELDNIMEHAQQQAELKIETLDKKVIADNKKLQSDLLDYKKEMEVLKQEKDKAVIQSKHIKTNISLQEDDMIEYRAIHVRQEKKIKSLKEKLQILKDYIAQEATDHAKQMETIKYQLQAKINELEIQGQSLKEELRLKGKETKNLKALSQIILDQRSEVEEFLLQTLDHVKEETRKQKLSERKNKLPELATTKSKIDLSLTSRSKKSWDRIDFTSLDWDDKEKILRILFSKMNAGLLPSNWRTSFLDTSNTSQVRMPNMPNYPASAQKAPLREIVNE